MSLATQSTTFRSSSQGRPCRMGRLTGLFEGILTKQECHETSQAAALYCQGHRTQEQASACASSSPLVIAVEFPTTVRAALNTSPTLHSDSASGGTHFVQFDADKSGAFSRAEIISLLADLGLAIDSAVLKKFSTWFGKKWRRSRASRARCVCGPAPSHLRAGPVVFEEVWKMCSSTLAPAAKGEPSPRRMAL